jgi:predicted metal-dependent phosphotriesterase family hydrolase
MSKISVDKLTKAYMKIKEKRSEIAKDFKTQDEQLVEHQEKIKKALLDYCKTENVNSVKTDHGTFYRSTRTKYWTSDWESMYRFVVDNQVPELLSKSLNQTNIKQFLEENPDLLPKGLNVDSEYVVSIRKS